MPVINLSTIINAPLEIVFDLSRSVELHQISTQSTNEAAVAGVTEGLLELGDEVTWRARHFGIYQCLTAKITSFDFPHSFTDEMVSGAFKSFEHHHTFLDSNGQVTMADIFCYKSPLGWLGNLADILFLKRYMRRFLITRNKTIKEYAESEKWKDILVRSQRNR